MQRCVGWSQSTLAVLQPVHTSYFGDACSAKKKEYAKSPVQRTPLYLPPTYASEEARTDEIGHHPQNLTNKHDKHKHDMMLQYVDEKLPT